MNMSAQILNRATIIESMRSYNMLKAGAGCASVVARELFWSLSKVTCLTNLFGWAASALVHQFWERNCA